MDITLESASPTFKNIQLFKEETLGIGSYGKVCRAKCDSVSCAAKIIHETLFDPTAELQMPQGRQHRLPFRRFEQECQFLSSIRHPNIIQYLGTYTDPDTGHPVLLMELMDESLTHFLEAATQQIPYHIQVNICYDIAMALTFLHANGIIHRDLSSNNILLISNSIRAKVTDFGMAKLSDINPQTSHLTVTKAPGTDVYMPPEAVQDQPVYCEKIDCFSFGVIVIQILTRQFPEPSERMQSVEINHPDFPKRTFMMCIPEIERRQNHISRVNPNHTLLPISLECLKDRDVERPSAQHICESIATLKGQSMYTDSMIADDKDCQSIENDMQRMSICDQPECADIKLSWRRGERAPAVMSRRCDAAIGDNEVYFIVGSEKEIYSYIINTETWSPLPLCPNRNCSLVVINNLLIAVGGLEGGFFSALSTFLGKLDGLFLPDDLTTDTYNRQYSNKLYSLKPRKQSSLQWIEEFPPMPTKRCSTTSVCTQAALIVSGGQGMSGDSEANLACVELMDRETLQWSTASCMPGGVYWASGVICGDCVYVGGGASNSVYSCSLSCLLQSRQLALPQSESNTTSIWKKLTDLPAFRSTLVSLCGQLLAIGGKSDRVSCDPSTSVSVYKNATESWEDISHMSEARFECFAVALPNNKMMVVGGCSDNGTITDSVEFADLIV